MSESGIAVIGAGVGGLAAAIDLAAQGHEVQVIERASSPGGKLRQVRIGDSLLDAGPTVFTMRWVFDEIFERAGTRLDAELPLTPLEILARHAWSDDERLDLFADRAQSAAAIGELCGAAEARRFLDFSATAERTYRTLESTYIRAARPSPIDVARRAGVGELWRTRPCATLWHALGTHFRDARLQQRFGRYATYCGSSPFLAPATLALIAHVEQAGVWLPAGGMHALALAMARVAGGLGVTFRYGCVATRILVEHGRVRGVELDNGERVGARAVVFNGDVAALGRGLLGEHAVRAVPASRPAARSLSALTWNLVTTTDGFPLHRHNVFFSGDYAAEFDDLFRRGRLPRSATVYVCAQDRGEGVPTGPERLLCLVNAPPVGDVRPLEPAEIEQCEQQSWGLMTRCGLRLDPPGRTAVVTTPSAFERLFPATGGALYGQASHGWRTSFTRPGARTALPGLYLAGGSTHPGAGVPMATLSGRNAAASLLADLGSTSRSPRVATHGGISTR